MARVLAISDLHQPWAHPRALHHLLKTRDKHQADEIIFMGDEIDAHAFSVRWPHNPDLPSAGDELKQAIEKLRPFYKEFPKATVLCSNHSMRIFKKARVTGMPSAVIRRYGEILNFPKEWVLKDDVEVDNVIYIHGDGFNKGNWRFAHKELKQSCAMAHLHAGAGIVYNQNKKGRYFSANFGCLISPEQAAFDYMKTAIDKPVIGCGVVLNGETAIFEPLPLKWL